jgi:hypothetical protein
MRLWGSANNMNANHPAQEFPATPEYILAVIKDSHRQQCQFDPEAELDVLLTFDSTVQEWRAACDLLGWRKLAKAMNKWFKTDFSDEQWKAVLEPAGQKKLRGVCELVATGVKRPEIKTFGHCESAGIFLTIRSMLISAGAQEHIKPSTQIAPFCRDYTEAFLDQITKLEPGALPPVKIHTPFYHGSCLAILFGFVICGIGSFISPLVVVFGVCITAFAYIAAFVAAGSRPAKVKFGSIETFRDLTMTIANARKERLAA